MYELSDKGSWTRLGPHLQTLALVFRASWSTTPAEEARALVLGVMLERLSVGYRKQTAVGFMVWGAHKLLPPWSSHTTPYCACTRF